MTSFDFTLLTLSGVMCIIGCTGLAWVWGATSTPLKSRRAEHGQGLVEYALILLLVAIVVIVALALLGPAIGNLFSNRIREAMGG